MWQALSAGPSGGKLGILCHRSCIPAAGVGGGEQRRLLIGRCRCHPSSWRWSVVSRRGHAVSSRYGRQLGSAETRRQTMGSPHAVALDEPQFLDTAKATPVPFEARLKGLPRAPSFTLRRDNQITTLRNSARGMKQSGRPNQRTTSITTRLLL